MAVVMTERPPLGSRVAHLRRQKALTQRQLADRVGVSPQTISNWENGVTQLPSGDVPAVAEALGVSIAGLYGDGFETAPAQRDTRIRSRWSEGAAGSGAVAGEFSESYNVAPLNEPRSPGVRPLPIYRWGSLGDPRDRESSPHPDREEYPPAGREHLIGPNGFGVEVRGHSMVGRDLHDGDVCWVNPDRPYRLGDLVLALVDNGNGDSGMVVKTYTHAEVGDCLMSETAEGRSTVVCSQFRIIGPVVGIQRWFPPSRTENHTTK